MNADSLPSSPGPTHEPSAPSSDFCSLDPRVIKLWRIRHLAGTGLLLGLLLIPALMVGVNFREAVRWAAGLWGVVALLRLGLLIWYPPKAYRAWGYRLDGRVLEIRQGVWFRTIQLLPLSRLQHVDLHSGPVERSFGLASLLLHTAGTHEATILLPGLEASEAARLRDHLVAVGGDDGV